MARPKKKAPVAVEAWSPPKDPIEWEQSLPIRQCTPAWRTTIKALYGTPLDEEELELFKEITGGIAPPPGGLKEMLAVVGRRGGKSDQIARIAVYECIFGNHGVALAPGQMAIFAVISPLRDQSLQILNYSKGLCALDQVKDFVLDEPTQWEIRFKTGVALRIMTADAVALSGPTCIGAVLDEYAKFPSDDDKAAMPDSEILNALRPAMAPIVGAPPRRLIGITSAYTKDGLAYKTDKESFGDPTYDKGILVVHGTTEFFNPDIDRSYLTEQRKVLGERVYQREFEGIWQDAVNDGFFPPEVIEKCIDRGREMSHPRDGVTYWICADPAWKRDSFALAAVHREREGNGPLITVVDRVWAWTPRGGQTLSTEYVINQIARICRQHECHVFYSDQAAAPALADFCKRYGLHLSELPWTAGVGKDSKSSKYRRVATAMADGLVRLPDDPETIREFGYISSKILKSGGETVEARGNKHDDRVSACVMAIALAMEREPDFLLGDGDVGSEYERLCAEARSKMDHMELAEMEHAERQAEEARWNKVGMGRSDLWSDEIDWNRISRYRGI